MMNPRSLLENYVVAPAYRFHHDYLSKYARHAFFKKIANFIFDKSKETALIMLFFNAVSIMSSHLSQIGGLKKSNRENKDYLINQEWKELGLDLVLTIIPPFLLNDFLMKKLDSGEWTTKSAREYLIETVAPTVGASREELYSIDHIRPFKESVKDTAEELIKAVKNSKKLPQFIDDKIPMPQNKFVNKLPVVSMEDITTDFDLIRKGSFKQFRNGKAFDEISGQRNGLLILATIAYTVLASNVVMPILKNKLANYTYKKQLQKQGETIDSVRRKKKFSYNKVPVIDKSGNRVFSEFSNANNSTLNISQNKQKIETVFNKNSTFNNFDKYSKIASQSIGLRI